ncbi:MAG: hypothetical protein ACPGU1_21170, partial [Myxococcota bacterium]
MDAAIPRAGIALMVVLGAGLFWWLQPLGAEYLVIQHGGGAEVWTACLCFFQLALLTGYLYAHAIGRWFPPTVALRLHGGMTLVAAMLLRHPSEPLSDQASIHLTWRIIAQLTRDIGPATVLLAATSPLTQLAYHRVTRRPPWRLYALANLAALLLLLTHPTLFEPFLSSVTQGHAWRGLLICYALACFTVTSPALAPTHAAHQEAERPPPPHPWLWIALAAAASALLIATTEALARDMASHPILWVAPLAVFLASIVITFDRPHLYRAGPGLVAMGLAMLAVIVAHAFNDEVPFLLNASAHLALLAAGATLCHGELYRARPASTEVTRYHLSMALGGALGGIAVAIGAPALSDRMVELPLSALCVCTAAALAVRRRPADRPLIHRATLGLIALALIAGALSLSRLEGALRYDQDVVLRSRNAYGTLTLVERRLTDTTKLMLIDGNTTHGEAHVAGKDVGAPTLYYA